MNKRGYEFSFAWIFAVLIGAFVIFLAIYFVFKVTDLERTKVDTTRAKQIGILLTPVETGLEDSKLVSILVPKAQETRLFNDCVPPTSIGGDNPFGTQKISALVKSGIGEDWQPYPGTESSFHNKYLFAREDLEAEKEFFVMSKPFMYPFKIADIVVMWPDGKGYCFVDMGAEVADLKTELKDRLKVTEKNIDIVDGIDNCKANSWKVCFGTQHGDCDLLVQASREKVTYLDSGVEVFTPTSTEVTNRYPMLLAAIFSEPVKYNCQSERIGARATSLARVYISKSQYLTATSECNSAPLLPISLNNYLNSAEGIGNSYDLTQLKDEAEDLKTKNAPLDCKLF